MARTRAGGSFDVQNPWVRQINATSSNGLMTILTILQLPFRLHLRQEDVVQVSFWCTATLAAFTAKRYQHTRQKMRRISFFFNFAHCLVAWRFTRPISCSHESAYTYVFCVQRRNLIRAHVIRFVMLVAWSCTRR